MTTDKCDNDTSLFFSHLDKIRMLRIRFKVKILTNLLLNDFVQVHFANPGDETNAFCVHFKTVPQDSTGIAHILEHVTLCGSEK